MGRDMSVIGSNGFRFPDMTGKGLILLRVTVAVVILLLHAGLMTSETAPCIECEHSLGVASQEDNISSNAQEIASRCEGTCQCPPAQPQCQDGVPLIPDGCGCCPICARQQGDVCNFAQPCDSRRKLTCAYPDLSATSGICRVKKGQRCQVNGIFYKDGETFKIDCRTQCTCQNGTYGCVSLCPHENVRPSPKCRNAQLVRIHGSCCREWMCESTHWQDRELHCKRHATDWSPCSTTCGIGISFRITNDNPNCELRNETRICQLRPCEVALNHPPTLPGGHHVRKHHLCRATVRSALPVRLSDGSNCTSRELYQPKFCGYCPKHRCCSPHITTTKKVQFHCTDDGEGMELLIQKDVLWIIKCNCTAVC